VELATILAAAFVILIIAVIAVASIKIVNQYERVLVFTLGRTSPTEVKGPGWVFIVPIAQRAVKVDLRERFIEVPSQTSITKDNAPISIDFLIYWRIVDPYRSVVEVQNFEGALQNIATTTLRAVVGDILLDDVLSKRDQINEVLRIKLDEVTERWGGKVTTVEIREITPPRDVQDAMNRQLSAERTRRAVITESEGTRQSAINVAEGTKQSEILKAEGDRQAHPSGRGLRPCADADLQRGLADRSEDDGAPIPRSLQGIGGEPVDQVRTAAGDHPVGRVVPRVPRRLERERRRWRLASGSTASATAAPDRDRGSGVELVGTEREAQGGLRECHDRLIDRPGNHRRTSTSEASTCSTRHREEVDDGHTFREEARQHA